MKPCAVDFETYYDDDCSVVPLGTVAYTRHPKFDAYMVSIHSEEYQFVGHPADCEWERIKDHLWLSHNAGFDQAVYQSLRDKDNVKFPAPKTWHCTSALAAYLGCPRDLATASKILLGKNPSKDMRRWMKGKTAQDAMAAGRWEELKEYARHDAELCYELWVKFEKYWPAHERLLSDLTYTKGAEGIYVDTDMLIKGLETLRQTIYTCEGKLPWVQQGLPPTSPKALAEACREAGIEPPVSTAEDDERCQAWEDKYSDQCDFVDTIRTYRKANRLIKILEKLKARTLCTNTITYSLKYFGAHTGRWSGGDGFNIQNLHKGDILGVDIRKILRARPGKKFVICDLSQIEPRVLAWKVKDEEMLVALRNGFGIYEAHARATMNWNGGKLKVENPELYKLAKARVLGLGYGCGAAKFVSVAYNMAGLEITLDFAQKCVNEFRASNQKIVQFWNQLEYPFKRASQPDVDENGKLKLEQDFTFKLPLPSGRNLIYRNVTEKSGYQAQVLMGEPMKWFWGGSLCENFVQATSRDVFAYGLLSLHKEGINVLFHVHDEYVCEVDQNFDQNIVREIVTQCPPWLAGCPIEAEVIETEHYTK